MVQILTIHPGYRYEKFLYLDKDFAMKFLSNLAHVLVSFDLTIQFFQDQATDSTEYRVWFSSLLTSELIEIISYF